MKQVRVLSLLLTLLLVFSGTAKAYESLTKTVVIYDKGNYVVAKTTKDTFAELFEKENYTLNENDRVSVKLSDTINDNDRVYIYRAFPVHVSIDGEKSVYDVSFETVNGLVNFIKTEKKCDFVVSDVKLSDPLKEGMEITLKSLEKKDNVVKTEIPFETIKVETEDLAEGVKEVSQKGVKGVLETTSKQIFVQGNLVSEDVVNETVLSEPVDEIIKVGTGKSIKTKKGDFKVSHEFAMVATAYTAKSSARTASGTLAKVGVVAVDPKVIPLGTKLYIDGYGHAVAGDTGSAIKGNKIDLFFNSHNEAINFGVKSLKVYVLK